ncbi:MAG TPA: class I SAM-dependent methyltransferase [Ferrovibrio sp.]|uniref:class I SAM-dependent methyltransferase n=1 Tax=Ferrovibrio sp. TaxID=1917215 RepID=UPI002B4AE114|nr:class I SAM-dependent methyltransferase [Ferrovibrio sp.]HLT78404.1 class I SAM-dependent methyltransferase [Ferrovibrio sp.]
MADILGSSAPARAWHAYYTEKRIVHQWMQVHLLQDLPVRSVIEIGPYLGLVTAMLANAGYRVTTFDIENRSPGIGAERHIQGDIRDFDPKSLPAADALICCETLEHIPWPEIPSVLARLQQTEIPWLILSVPYEGTQLAFSIYLNRFTAKRRSMFRKFRFLKNFRSPADAGWEPHKWEIGYRGYSVEKFRDTLERAGWQPVRQEFTEGCRSIFLVCRNTGKAA